MIYAQLSNGVYAIYDGMSSDTVTVVLAAQGLTYTAITQDQFQAGTAHN